jgi:hypothetical protein
MAWTITNEGNNIKFVDGTTIFSLSKATLAFAVSGDEITIKDGNFRVKTKYTNVSSPSVASAVLLAAEIEKIQKTNASDADTTTKVAYSNTSTQLIAADPARKGLEIFNSTDAKAYVLQGTGTVVVGDDIEIDVDKGRFVETSGEVQFICDTATAGNMIVVEYF